MIALADFFDIIAGKLYFPIVMATPVKKTSSTKKKAGVMQAKALSQMDNTQYAAGDRPTTKSPNTLAYIIPPILLAGIFAFCAMNPFTPQVEETGPVASAEQTYTWSSDEKNLLTSGTVMVAQSGSEIDFAARNAIDSVVADDELVSCATPDGSPAWWKVDLIKSNAGRLAYSIVIYGGGENSPMGKLAGGFEVQLETADGERFAKRFCEDGFPLEGYEVWDLEYATPLTRILITSLTEDKNLVLREVQAIGPKK